MSYQLPPLGHAFDTFAPIIDSETMELHHGKHHAGYVNNLNKALENESKLSSYSVEELLLNINDVPESIRTAVRNNGGGHANHSMFWKILAPKSGQQPAGELLKAITENFGSLDELKTKFNDSGAKQFGSGWVFLIADPSSGKLEIAARPNQDSVLMEKKQAILGNDVWEHAYYLTYRNRRADYLSAWWDIVNWDAVEDRYKTILDGKIAS